MERLRSKATWGVAQTREGVLRARLTTGDGLQFECGAAQPVAGERILAGLSAAEVALRKVVLPFVHRDQIRAVLPQESSDALINRPETPRFAFHAAPEKNGKASRVLYAVADERRLRAFMTASDSHAASASGVVLAELAAWPLLEAAELLKGGAAALVVDASADPAAVFRLDADGPADLRLASAAATAAGEEALRAELAWLAGALIGEQDGGGDEGGEGLKTLFLGRTSAFWEPLLALEAWGGAQRPPLQSLGQGLREWRWLRPAGLALAARRGHARLLDFQEGAAVGIPWREWLAPWRPVLLFFLALSLVWGGREGLRFAQAQSRFAHFKHETEAAFREALPKVPVIVNPTLQLKQVLMRAAPEESRIPKLGEWLALIQTRVPHNSQVRWLHLRYEAGEVRLQGEAPSYEHLDRIRAALQSAPQVREVRMEDAHIVAKSKIVRFRLRLL